MLQRVLAVCMVFTVTLLAGCSGSSEIDTDNVVAVSVQQTPEASVASEETSSIEAESSKEVASSSMPTPSSTAPTSSKEETTSNASSKTPVEEVSSAPTPNNVPEEVASSAVTDVNEALPNVFLAYVTYWPTNVNVVDLLDCENFVVTGAAFNYVEYAESDDASISFSWKNRSLTCTVTAPGDYFITIECTSKVTGKVVYRDTIVAFG